MSLTLNMRQVAALVGISYDSVRSWHYALRTPPAGFPRAIKIGKSVRWLASDIDNWLHSMSVAAGNPPAPMPAEPKPAKRGPGRPRKLLKQGVQAGGLGMLPAVAEGDE